METSVILLKNNILISPSTLLQTYCFNKCTIYLLIFIPLELKIVYGSQKELSDIIDTNFNVMLNAEKQKVYIRVAQGSRLLLVKKL